MTRKRTAFAVLVALVFSAAYLRDSVRNGRLRQDLQFDDVVYTLDAARRLQVAESQGVAAFARTLVETPPHSPLETALAVAGLRAFGVRDVAPYLTNALLLAAGALLIVFLFRRQRAWVVALLVLAYLGSPLAYRTLTDFRPDFALGLATAAFAVLFLRGALERDVLELRLSGLALGVALLAKPPFLPHTIAIAVFVVGVALALRWWARVDVAPPRQLAGAFLGAGIALPYYAVAWREVVAYVWTNTKGSVGAYWRFPPSMHWWTVLYRYTLDRRYYAFPTAGFHLHAFLAVSVAGCAWLAVHRRVRELRVVLAVLAVAALSIAIIVAGRMDAMYFAVPFQTLLMTAAFLALSYGLEDASGRRAAALCGSVAVLFLGAIAADVGLQRQPPHPEIVRGASWNEAIVAAIRADVASQGRAAAATDGFVTFASAVNATALEWIALKAGLHMSFRDRHRSGSLDELWITARGASYVVVADPERADLQSLPSTPHQAALLARLRADPASRPVPCSVGDAPPRYHLFANGNTARELRPVFEDPRVERVEGFAPDEGPYPQWNLHVVRWLSARAGRVCLKGDAGAPTVDVTATIYSEIHGTLRVERAGAVLAAVPLDPGYRFRDVRFSVPVAPEGSCLELDVEGTIADPKRLVLFRRFEVRDAALR